MLLHCSLAHGGVWKTVVAPLADRMSCVAPDMPGHGKTPAWDGRGEVHDAVTAGARPLLDRPSHIVGHSFGATVAMRLGMEQPELVLSLTLIEPVIVAAARGTDVFDRYREQLQPYLEARGSSDWPAMARAFHQAWGGGTPWETLPNQMRVSIVNLMPMIAASEACLSEDSCHLLGEGQLEKLTMPVAFLRGGDTQKVV